MMFPAEWPRVAMVVATLFFVKPVTFDAIMDKAMATVHEYA